MCPAWIGDGIDQSKLQNSGTDGLAEKKPWASDKDVKIIDFLDDEIFIRSGMELMPIDTEKDSIRWRFFDLEQYFYAVHDRHALFLADHVT